VRRKNKLKITYFSWEYPPAIWGGLGTFVYEITKKLVSKGNNVTVYALNYQNKLKTLEKQNGLQIYRPKLVDLTSTYRLFANQDLTSWKENFKFFSDVVNYNTSSASHLINNMVKENKETYDLIDAHDWLGIIGGMTVKKELDIPLMFHVHSTETGRSLGGGSQTIKEIELKGAQTADCIITVSYAMKEHLKNLGYPEEKIRVCWNGVDPNKYNPNNVTNASKMALRKKYNIKDDETMLFFIGRLVTVKGIDNLMKAMPDVIKEYPKTKLVILGIGDLEEEIQSYIKQTKLKDNIVLRAEFVSEEERILHYATADIVILPSLYEPFGIVCTEAMSMGKPVVIGARGTNGMREQVIASGNNQCGVHINPYDPNDISWGIKQVLKTNDKGEKMGENGRERVLKEFTWDDVGDRTINIYKEFL
jgi:glycosyltransferase involved in cell wall biosynthesis